MAKPPTNIPPRSRGGAASRTGTKPVPPRPPRKPPADRRRRGSRSQGRFYGLLVGAAIAVAAIVIAVVVASGGSSKVKQPINWVTTTGVKVYGGLGPENVPMELGTQLASPNAGLTGAPIDGLVCNSTEQLTYHHHAHMMIFVNGQPRPIPLGVGMVAPALVQQTSTGDFATGSQTCLYWLHVHAQDGILHIESPTPKTYVLAQFFGIWQLPISATQVGPDKGAVTATVDGTPWTGDPGQIPLNEHTQIVLNVGGPIVTPPPINWSGTNL